MTGVQTCALPICTRKMHEIAEAGVAAHWLYKNGGADLNDVQKRAHQWLKSLLDIQSEAGDSSEFLEHVKIDLFPDAVYVFTPKSKIMALPRGATALDFAYSIHNDCKWRNISKSCHSKNSQDAF